ncbi:phosphoserine phosphatase [Leptospira ellinghausenii]|uniref:Phosphoserine phosphatase n=1 Tax=Leptospira ellinghausenii TaxID=1917822 RepID=A0A2P2DDC2_9LEPT|nr:phosphoserine phosphatase SerB [Leptospira ellinghausenii]GBF42640.1 phosphoserine phosphatase [Leptospira ellinghausenii]
MNSILLISHNPIPNNHIFDSFQDGKVDPFTSSGTIDPKTISHSERYGLHSVRILIEESWNRNQIVTIRERFAKYKIDLLYLPFLLPTKQTSLFIFDMDSTVIREEVIDELARKHGVFEEVASVTKRAMEGGMGFDEALRLRVKHLAGLSIQSFKEVYDLLHLNDGMETVFQFLSSNGCKLGILSGGFSPVLELFSKKYPVDFFRANGLEEKDGFFTGQIVGEIINREKKEVYLRKYANEFSVPLERVVAVGDGANDALMLNAAGIGIGIHAKQGLKDQIINWIEFTDLSALVFLFESSF